jgi:peptide deformylase
LAVREILELPHPTLRQRARKVRTIGSPVLRLAYDMVDTMREAGGIGLAANQVGVLRRVIVLQLPEEDEASIYVNPEIVHRQGEREVEEGCLSIPGYRGLITRSLWVRFRAMDHTTKLVKLKAEGMLSQVLEHEVDHLNGILYIDHLESHQQLIPVESQSEDGEPVEEDGTPATALDSGDDHHEQQELSVEHRSEGEETPASLKVR